ncbi:MAG: hypothetical protein IKL59_00090 [Clostridia bacterium]|nr:hypothetical protein [Clostridia bacterium]
MKKNKKKLTIILIALVVLILIFPMYRGRIKDGGTKKYTALTYKVIKWHRLIDVDDGSWTYYRKTRVYFFPQNLLSTEELWDLEVERENLHPELSQE